MTLSTIGVGAAPNDGTGDTLRAAMGKVNANFAELIARHPSVGDYGAVGDGSTDDTSAIQDAIDAVGADGVVVFPPGTYKITSTLTVSDSRVHLIGAGMYATEILFAPTANDTALFIDGGGSVLYQGSIRDMAFYSADSTYTKVAIDLVDTSGWVIENIAIAGSVNIGGVTYWAGNSASIGLRTKGREFNQFRNLYIQADRPILIADNPNSSIDVDHFHFLNTYLIANANPCVQVDTGLNVTQLTMEGANPWVLGTHGFYWNDTTSAGVSNGVTLKNIRTEQGTSATAYQIYIAHNTSLQNLAIEGCYANIDRKGIYLRKVLNASLFNHFHAGANEALNVDSTVARISGQSCYWQASSTLAGTLSAMGQVMLYGSGYNPSTGCLPPDFVLDLATSTNRAIILGGGVSELAITVANDGVASLGATGMAGLLVVTASEGRIATFVCKGTNNSVAEVSDPDSVFSHTKDNASTTNVYYDSGYKLQNKRGVEVDYKILLIGSYETF